MADNKNISDLEKEFEAKMNAVVANEAYKASLEEAPEKDASLGGTIDISNLLNASKVLGAISGSISSIKSSISDAYSRTKEKTPANTIVPTQKESLLVQEQKEKGLLRQSGLAGPDNTLSFLLNNPNNKGLLKKAQFLKDGPTLEQFIRGAGILRADGLNRQNSTSLAKSFLNSKDSPYKDSLASVRKQIEEAIPESNIKNYAARFAKTFVQEIAASLSSTGLSKSISSIKSSISDAYNKNRTKALSRLSGEDKDLALKVYEYSNKKGYNTKLEQFRRIDSFINGKRENKYQRYLPPDMWDDFPKLVEGTLGNSSIDEFAKAAGVLKRGKVIGLNSNQLAKVFLETHPELNKQSPENSFESIRKKIEQELPKFNIREIMQQWADKMSDAIIPVAKESFKKLGENLKTGGSKAISGLKTGFTMAKSGLDKIYNAPFVKKRVDSWRETGSTIKDSFLSWKEKANENLKFDNNSLSGFLKNSGVGLAKSLLTTIGLSKTIPMLGIGAELFKKAAMKLYDAGVSGLKAFGEIQAIQTNLGVVYGNQSEADQMFEKLSSYAVKSPFSTSQIANFAVLLKQSGVYSSDIENTLKMLGDTAGGNEDKMSRIANNYAQIVAMGKATSMDLRQFANANIPIYEELKKQLGNISQKELRQITAAGGITSDIIEKAFVDMTSEGGRFANATEKGADTYKAKSTNLEDIKQLGMSEFGKMVYNLSLPGLDKSIAQTWMDLQEWWYSSFVTGLSKSYTNRYESKKINQKGFSSDVLTSLLDSVNKQTTATNKNSEFLKKLTEDEKSSYGSFIDNARSFGSRKYIEKADEAQRRIDIINYLAELVSSTSSKKEFNDLKNTKEFISLIKEAKISSSLLEDKYAAEGVLKNAVLRNEADILKAQKANGGKNYNWYLQAQGIALTRNAAESFGKQSKAKNSSTSIDADIYEMYKRTDAYKKEEDERNRKRIEEAKKLLEEQKRLGITEEGFSWINNNPKLRTEDLSKVLSDFYGNTQLDISSENLTADTKKALLENVQSLSPRIESAFSGKQLRTVQDLNARLTEELSKTPKSKSEERKIAQRINKIAGEYKDFIDNLKDETEKILLNALFIDPKAALLNSSQIKAAEETVQKSFKSFWKRYTSSMLGISIKALEKGNFEKDFKENYDRELNQSIAAAMLESGSSYSRVLSFRALKPGVYTGENRETAGVDQAATASNFKEYAMSTQSNASVTNAYANQLRSTISKLQSFLAGATFKKEDLETLYDEIGGESLGYNSKEEFVNAFSGAVDATGKFKEGIIASTDAILKETQARLKNTSVLGGLKDANEKAEKEIQSTKGMLDINTMWYGSPEFRDFSNLPQEEKTKALAAISGVYKEDVPGMLGDMRGYFSGSATKSDKLPALKEARIALEEAEKNFSEADKKIKDMAVSLDELNSGSSPDISDIAENYLSAFESYYAAKESYVKEFAKASNEEINKYKEIQSLFEKYKEIHSLTETQQVLSSVGNMMSSLISSAGITSEDEMPDSFGQLVSKSMSRSFAGGFTGVDRYGSNTTRQQSILDSFGLKNMDFGTAVKDAFSTGENSDGTFYVNEGTAQYKYLETARDLLIEMGGSAEKIGRSLDFSSLDISTLKDIGEILGSETSGAIKLQETVKDLGKSFKQNLTASLGQGLEKTCYAIGESLAGSSDSVSDIAKGWKDVAKNILSTLASSMTQAGLSLITYGATTRSKADIAAGFALAAAGGIAGIAAGLAGYEDKSSDSDDNSYEDKINNLKNALSDLIDQAKTDAEYYQKNLLHKQALSENDYYSAKSISVNDAVITPNGNVISTAPDDYLIATKTPDTLIGNNARSGEPNGMEVNFSPVFNFIDQTTHGVQTEVKENYDDEGNMSLDIVLKNAVGDAIANGELDSAFSAREYRLQGKTVAW